MSTPLVAPSESHIKNLTIVGFLCEPVGRMAQAGWEAGESFTIITTEPNELVRPDSQPHARDPTPEDEEQWLDASRTPFAKAKSLLKPYPDELMDAHDVSPIVNSAKYDGPECIRPVSDDEIPTRRSVVPVVSNLESLEHLIRPRQHVRRNCQADLLGGFQIDDELKFRRLLDRQVGWLCSFENLVDIDGGAPVQFCNVWPIGHQAHQLPQSH